MQKETDAAREVIKLALEHILQAHKVHQEQIEEYKFDAAIGKFVREFEHIKGEIILLICRYFSSQGLDKDKDAMVRYIFKENTLGSILQNLAPMYYFVNPHDEAGQKGLRQFSLNIGILNTNRNNLIHQYHLELDGTMKDSGKKVRVRSSISAKQSTKGVNVKAVIYRTSAIEECIQYVIEVRDWLSQCSNKITNQEDISTLLDAFNKKPVPGMGKTINVPP